MIQPDASGLPNVNDLGRIIPTLDGTDLLVFVLLVIIIIQVVDRWSAAVSMRAERKDMAEERARMWSVADKFGTAADKLTVELQVQAGLNARVETALKRCEDTINGDRSA